MSWPIRLIKYEKETSGSTLQVGDAFYFTPPPGYDDQADDDEGWYWPGHFATGERLSAQYREQHQSRRAPILVFLPGRTLFCVDGACWNTGPDNKIVYHGGWTVSGDLPNISVSPSINIVGSYHGFITNGVITDDCEGRKFDETGRHVK